jgi:multidrug resistance efflux pump
MKHGASMRPILMFTLAEFAAAAYQVVRFQKSLERANADLAAANGDLRRAEASLQIANGDLEQFVISAGQDGDAA